MKVQTKDFFNESLNKYVCLCGKQFDNSLSFAGHCGHCDKIAQQYHNKEHCRDFYHMNKGHMVGWENKSEEEITEIYNKGGNTRKIKYNNGELVPGFLGKHHTEETKEKQRIGMLKNICFKFGNVRANYSQKACDYIDKLNSIKHWHLKHALNDGEKFVAGYFLDGYDEQLNIAFEYDEKKHYKDVNNNILTDKDLIRQNNIINKLHCSFFRYNETLDKLYKV